MGRGGQRLTIWGGGQTKPPPPLTWPGEREERKEKKREAKSGFNDERIFIERYVEKSRHIEIQILGDKAGNVIYVCIIVCSPFFRRRGLCMNRR